MITKKQFIKVCQDATQKHGCDCVLLSYYDSQKSVTKFNVADIIQNMQENETSLCVKVFLKKRSASASCTQFTKQSIQQAIGTAKSIALLKPKEPVYVYPKPLKRTSPEITTFFPETIKKATTLIPKWIKKIRKEHTPHTFDCAGTITAGYETMGVYTTTGIEQFQPFTLVSTRVITHKDQSTGFSTQVSRDISTMDIPNIARTSVTTCVNNSNAKTIPLGKYDCIISPFAVNEILSWLSYIGLGAKSNYENASFMNNQIDKQIMGSNFSLIDDGINDPQIAIPFDFEGIPRKKLALIDKGVAKHFVLDSYYGKVFKKKSTGHALTPDSTEGPFPLSLSIPSGKHSVEDMIQSVKKGLYITRFHYLNGFLNPKRAAMTGLTRNGLFMIKNGKLSDAVKDMRFTQDMLTAFSNILMISKERQYISEYDSAIGTSSLPYLLIKDFTFTSRQ